MATNTYVALDRVTVGTATSLITFSSIPQTYTDLVIIANGTASASAYTKLYFNGITTNTYSATNLYGTGSGVGSARQTTGEGKAYIQCYYNYANANPTMMKVNIFNYANSSVYKTVLLPDYDAAQEVTAKVGLWASTAPINSVTLERVSGNWNIGTTFSLYGIAAEGTIPTPKATGGAIYSDSTYYYHVFGATGTFTPTQSITADILVIAGGGQGGGGNGGGGGAGGLRYFASQSLTSVGYTCTIGAGGSGGLTNAAGGNGGNSQFGSLTLSTGGGGGGGYSAGAATSGGSGGGGGTAGNTTAGAASPSGQGNAGGSGHVTDNLSGGGGGSGAAGGVGTTTTSGAGGNGTSTYSSWGFATGVGQNVAGAYYIAGGGSGGGDAASGNAIVGAAGYGGGGIGGSESTNASTGVANTGSGGGGEGGGGAGANGGSGVIIVRYAKV